MNRTLVSIGGGMQPKLPPVRVWVGAVHMKDEARICLARVRFEMKDDHDRTVSNKWSLSLCWKPQDGWIGAFWQTTSNWNFYLWICILPCLPIRIHRVRTWGGIIP